MSLELISTSGKRELEVLRQLCLALTPTEIAARLHMSVATVRGHIARMMKATGCVDSRKLMRWGLMHPKILAGEMVVMGRHAEDCGCLICCAGNKAAA